MSSGSMCFRRPDYTEDYAIAVAKGNTELLEKINAALDELIKDGTIRSVIDKYIK